MGLFDFFKKDKTDVEKYYDDRKVQNTPFQDANNFSTPASMNNYSIGANFQFTVEDVFFISGRGAVVTGRVASGEVRLGDIVTLVKHDGTRRNVRVTGIEMFRKKLDMAVAGNNAGILISELSRDEVQRGDMLIK